ncbi:MAG: Flp family type IVb pilin [Actinomycetota bacterium]
MDLFQFVGFTGAWLGTKIRSRIEFRSERGATAVEYGLMVALIAAVIVAVVVTLGTQIHNAFCSVVNGIAEGGIGGACEPKGF